MPVPDVAAAYCTEAVLVRDVPNKRGALRPSVSGQAALKPVGRRLRFILPGRSRLESELSVPEGPSTKIS